jgi:hypothetical protein
VAAVKKKPVYVKKKVGPHTASLAARPGRRVCTGTPVHFAQNISQVVRTSVSAFTLL